MACAYNGKILWVDLTTGLIESRFPDPSLYRDYLGGSGLAARLIFEHQPVGADPMGEDNILGFMAGLMGGTRALLSARYMLVGKSPLTGGWTESNSGGYLSGEMKKAGYDGVFFTGISKKPVYLFIENNRASLRPADHLWGKDTRETEKLIKTEDKCARARVACIGPAGENLSFMAGVVHEEGRVAARGGLGAVMGKKRLKALVIRGTGKIKEHDPEAVREINRSMVAIRHAPVFLQDRIFSKIILGVMPVTRRVMSFARATGLDNAIGKGAKVFQVPLIRVNARVMAHLSRTVGWDYVKKYGTSAFTVLCGELGDTPIKNWQGAMGPEYTSTDLKKLSNEKVTALTEKPFSCDRCPLACGGKVRMPPGDYSGQTAHQPEYESIAALGPLCLNKDLQSIINLNETLNRAGMDTISAGTVLAFAIEAYEKGVITKEDTDGLELTWGDSRAMALLLDKIIHRRGIGDILADGVRLAAERLGPNARPFAVHAGGQEPSMHHPLAVGSLALTYTMDPAPGRHTNSMTPYGLLMGLPDIYPGHYQGPSMVFSGKKNLALMVRRHALTSWYIQAFGSAGFCLTGVMMGGAPVRQWISAGTGWDLTDQELIQAGRRGLAVKTAFNAREGISPDKVGLPGRLLDMAKKTGGPLAGRKMDIRPLKQAYCQEQGWDEHTGFPTRDLQRELGLSDLVAKHSNIR